MATILIIEDEQALAQSVLDALQHHGYSVLSASNGLDGIALVERSAPDAIILDLMLPDMDGFDVCSRLRGKGIRTPILILTARNDEMDCVVGLEIGADDYITKPFRMRELLARVKARLRRTETTERETHEYRFGNAVVNTHRYIVFRDGKEFRLTSTECMLLELLIKRRNDIVTREEIMNQVRGYDYYPNSRTIDNHVVNLRQKLEQNPHKPEHILTVHGIGYKLVD